MFHAIEKKIYRKVEFPQKCEIPICILFEEIVIAFFFIQNDPLLLSPCYLGNEFYLFVSHGGMNDRGSTSKFRNARSAFRNLHVDPLSFILP